jgi:hypothetical protein
MIYVSHESFFVFIIVDFTPGKFLLGSFFLSYLFYFLIVVKCSSLNYLF